MQTSRCPSNTVSSTLYPLGKRMGGSQSRLDVVERSVCSCRESDPSLACRGQSLYWAMILYRFITEGVGRDSADGIATGYELDGPGIQSRWGARFSAPIQTGPGAHPASCAMGTRSFPGIKRPGRGVDRPPPSSTVVKERVKLCTSTPPSGPWWPVARSVFHSLCLWADQRPK